MQITRPSQFGSRSGITIIEVLTAMVVAMIGVFGIMVLIPFAIKQAETGLDYDDANRVARNAVEQFEIGGHDRLIGGLPTWFAPDDMDNVVRVGSLPIPGPPDSVPPGIDVYVIDPLSIGFHANPGFNGFGQFPPASSFDPAFNSNYPRQGRYMPVVNNEFPYLPEANLGTYDSRINPDPVAPDPATPRLIPMEFAESVRMFRATDDLEFGTFDDFTTADMATYAPGVPDKKLLPPRMYFDSAAGVELRRQARGEMSWQMILVPVKDDYVSTTFPADSSSGSRWYTRNGAWKFRQFTLVYSNRVLDKSQMVMRPVFCDASRAIPTSF